MVGDPGGRGGEGGANKCDYTEPLLHKNMSRVVDYVTFLNLGGFFGRGGGEGGGRRTCLFLLMDGQRDIISDSMSSFSYRPARETVTVGVEQ